MLQTYGLEYPTLSSLTHDDMSRGDVQCLSLITVDFYEEQSYGDNYGELCDYHATFDMGIDLSYFDKAVAKLSPQKKFACLFRDWNIRALKPDVSCQSYHIFI